MRNYLFLFGFILSVVFSCNDDIFMQEEFESLIIVDGWIEDGEFANVLITRNTPYFTVIDSSSYYDLVVIIANVRIFNGQEEEILTCSRDENIFPNEVYKTTNIKGEIGKTYKLTISLHVFNDDYPDDDTVLTAISSIPVRPKIDTAWYELAPKSDSLYICKLKFTDDSLDKNYYRILSKTTKEIRFSPIVGSAVDDNLFEFPSQIYPVIKGNLSQVDNLNEIYFKKGDTVTIKFCAINKDAYLFWYHFQFESINAINPFASSNIQLQGNVYGKGGIGIWSGEAADYYKLIIK